MTNVLTFHIPVEMQTKLENYAKEHSLKSRSHALREIVNNFFEKQEMQT